MDLDPFERDVLILGLGDDVSLGEVTSLAIRKYAADEPTKVMRDRSLAVVERLVRRNFFRIGTLDERGGFLERNDEVDALLREVREEYDGSPEGTWRDVFWLRITPAGRSAAPSPVGYNPFDEDRRSGAGPGRGASPR